MLTNNFAGVWKILLLHFQLKLFQTKGIYYNLITIVSEKYKLIICNRYACSQTYTFCNSYPMTLNNLYRYGIVVDPTAADKEISALVIPQWSILYIFRLIPQRVNCTALQLFTDF